MYLYPSYHEVTSPAQLMRVVDVMAAKIKEWLAAHPEKNITHMVLTGTSGQSIGWPVSYKIGLPVAVVRKDADRGHAGKIVGTGEIGNYIVLDDQISIGATIQRIHDELTAYSESGIRPYMDTIFLYHSSREHSFALQDGREVPVIGESVVNG